MCRLTIWQSDEVKYSKRYGTGPDAVFVDALEFDKRAQSYLEQISILVSDPSTGAGISAMTIGQNAEAFF